MSKTEGIFNVMAHRLDEGPYTPILYIGPTEKLVKSISDDRWKKVLRSTPRLWSRTAKGHQYKTVEQFIGGVRAGWAWAGSKTEMAAHPAGIVLIDERGRMVDDVQGEGDPVTVASARTKNYPNRKIGIFSTPTIEGADSAWSLLEQSAMQFWSWACPHCEERFIPELALLKWPKNATPGEAMHAAFVVCPHCGGEIRDADKESLNATGCYLPYRPREDDEEPLARNVVMGSFVPTEPDPQNPHKGFWASGLVSTFTRFGEIAMVLVAAYQSRNDSKIQAAINTWGGQLFVLRGEAPQWREVERCKLSYPRRKPQPGGRILTLGADVQADGIYYVVRDWGVNSESWLIDEGFYRGATDYDDVWLAFGDLIQVNFGGRRIAAGLIDSGYRPGDEIRRPDHVVYTFCRRYPGMLFPSKGYRERDKPLSFSKIDYLAGGVAVKGGVTLAHVDTDYFKRQLYSRIRKPRDGKSTWHCHHEISQTYCRSVVSEELKIKPSGERVWVRRDRHNHYLDCEILAAAAAIMEGVEELEPEQPRQPEMARPMTETVVDPSLQRRQL